MALLLTGVWSKSVATDALFAHLVQAALERERESGANMEGGIIFLLSTILCKQTTTLPRAAAGSAMRWKNK